MSFKILTIMGVYVLLKENGENEGFQALIDGCQTLDG